MSLCSKVVKKVFMIAGITLASGMVYQLIMKESLHKDIFKLSQNTYRTTWADQTYGNGTAINSSVQKDWDFLAIKNGTAELGLEDKVIFGNRKDKNL